MRLRTSPPRLSKIGRQGKGRAGLGVTETNWMGLPCIGLPCSFHGAYKGLTGLCAEVFIEAARSKLEAIEFL